MLLGPVTSSKLRTEEILEQLGSIITVILLDTDKITSFLISPDTATSGSKDIDSIRTVGDNA